MESLFVAISLIPFILAAIVFIASAAVSLWLEAGEAEAVIFEGRAHCAGRPVNRVYTRDQIDGVCAALDFKLAQKRAARLTGLLPSERVLVQHTGLRARQEAVTRPGIVR